MPPRPSLMPRSALGRVSKCAGRRCSACSCPGQFLHILESGNPEPMLRRHAWTPRRRLAREPWRRGRPGLRPWRTVQVFQLDVERSAERGGANDAIDAGIALLDRLQLLDDVLRP